MAQTMMPEHHNKKGRKMLAGYSSIQLFLDCQSYRNPLQMSTIQIYFSKWIDYSYNNPTKWIPTIWTNQSRNLIQLYPGCQHQTVKCLCHNPDVFQYQFRLRRKGQIEFSFSKENAFFANIIFFHLCRYNLESIAFRPTSHQ